MTGVALAPGRRSNERQLREQRQRSWWSAVREAAKASRSPQGAKLPKVKEHYNKREAIAGYLFIAPWIIGFLVFTAGAMVYSLYISFSNYNLATNRASPVGFANYAQLFEDPKVALALANTLYFAVLAVPLEIIARPRPRHAAQSHDARRRRLPDDLLPPEDDARRGDGIRLLPAAQRQHRCDQPGTRASSASRVRSG